MHCQGHVREAFSEWLEAVEVGQARISDGEFVAWNDERFSIQKLLGQLQNCTDILSGFHYGWLELEGRQTYAAAVRQIRRWRKA